MKNLKRVLSLALATVMVIGMMVVGANAAFVDQDSISYKTAVDTLVALKVIDGMGDNTFAPNGTLTRAQAAKMVAYVKAGANTTTISYYDGTTKFTDVGANHSWAAGSINYCVATGIIAGMTDTTYAPDGTLTGAQLAKMLLVALGYKAETSNKAETLVGANSLSNAIRMASETGLFAGLNSGFAASKAVTREEACQMIYNALSKDTKTVLQAVDGYYTYSNSGKTLLAASFPIHTTSGVVDGITAGSDDFDRPGTLYTFTTASKLDPVLVLDVPVATVKGVATQKDLFAAIGAKGTVNGDHKEISVVRTYNDGKVDNTAVTIANNGTTAASFTGNGTITEIYETATANQYVAVVIKEYVGTVASVTPANATTGTKRTVTVTLPVEPTSATTVTYTIETEDFAVLDTVLVTMAETTTADTYALKSITGAKSISGKVTKITNGNVYTIGGSDYMLSANNNSVTLNLNDSGSWYVDSMGNVIAVKAADVTAWNYGYLVGYAKSDYRSDNLLGTGATVAAEKFQLITAAGEKVVMDGAFSLNTNGTVAAYVGTALTGANADPQIAALVRYKVDGNGKIAVIEEVKTTGTVNGAKDAAATALTATKGVATLNGKYVTDSTVFIAYQDATHYTVYTGYKNIPATLVSKATDNTDWEYFYATAANGADDSNTIGAIVMQVASASAQTESNYVYFATADKTTETTTDGTVTTFTNVYLNGTKGELKFLNAADAYLDGIVAGKLYTYTTDTKTGYAAINDDAAVATLAGATAITSIQSGYYVAGSVQYVGANTAYYQVDATTGAVTQATGLPALNAAYTVKSVYVDTNNATTPATVVYFTVA